MPRRVKEVYAAIEVVGRFPFVSFKYAQNITEIRSTGINEICWSQVCVSYLFIISLCISKMHQFLFFLNSIKYFELSFFYYITLYE